MLVCIDGGGAGSGESMSAAGGFQLFEVALFAGIGGDRSERGSPCRDTLETRVLAGAYAGDE